MIDESLPTGSEVAGYVIERVLGQGGFAITYLAHDAHLVESRVALKEYFPQDLARRTQRVEVAAPAPRVQAYQEGLERFLEEARTLIRLPEHPGVVRAHRYVPANGTAYLVMEYVAGESLADALKRRPRSHWDEERVRRLAAQLLDALRVVHGSGVWHRDVNPSNVLLRADERPVLIDFGASRQVQAARTRTGQRVATSGYSPPEQYGADYGEPGSWSDLYALGATLYEVVTGMQPADSLARLAARLKGKDPLVPAVVAATGLYPAELLGWIDQHMALEEGARPQTAEQSLAGLLGLSKANAVPRTAPVGQNERFRNGRKTSPKSSEAPALGKADMGEAVVPRTLPVESRDRFQDSPREEPANHGSGRTVRPLFPVGNGRPALEQSAAGTPASTGRRWIKRTLSVVAVLWLAVLAAASWWGLPIDPPEPDGNRPRQVTAATKLPIDAPMEQSLPGQVLSPSVRTPIALPREVISGLRSRGISESQGLPVGSAWLMHRSINGWDGSGEDQVQLVDDAGNELWRYDREAPGQDFILDWTLRSTDLDFDDDGLPDVLMGAWDGGNHPAATRLVLFASTEPRNPLVIEAVPIDSPLTLDGGLLLLWAADIFETYSRRLASWEVGIWWPMRVSAKAVEIDDDALMMRAELLSKQTDAWIAHMAAPDVRSDEQEQKRLFDWLLARLQGGQVEEVVEVLERIYGADPETRRAFACDLVDTLTRSRWESARASDANLEPLRRAGSGCAL